MNAPARNFEAKPAVRESVPLLVGLMGPSGSGKTFSALRLATGIQQVTGGDIFGIDTEARRMLHYADHFRFRHVQFDAPFCSLDYLSAIRHCVSQGAKVIVVDSMTHEHSGPGGYLLTQEAELNRMAGDDYAKRQRVKMAAWIKPAALRQEMITGILQLNASMIFCFRAKEKTKPIKGGGVQEMGFMPVAGEELLFEMTVNCLLLPRANGVPTWRSDQIGERLMMKRPLQFEKLFSDERALDEQIGVTLATWARGGSPTSATGAGAATGVEPHAAPASPTDELTETLMRHDKELGEAATQGMAALKAVYDALPADIEPHLRSAVNRRHKPNALRADHDAAWGKPPADEKAGAQA